MGESLDDFQGKLGHRFADTELLRQALTHASFGHEKKQRMPDNQRLEFLGDAVLQLAVTSELYRRFPEENSQGRQRPSILADAMEAVIGAVYAEAGWEPARAIVLQLMEPSLAAITSEDVAEANPKGSLQEKLQAGGDNPPAYRCVSESGPAHARVYEVVVEWQGRELGRGQGASKKEAETRAAESALAGL